MKTVTRTYYSKRAGNFVTKTYTYDKKYSPKKGGKSLLIVNKQGKIFKDRLAKLLDSIDDPADKADIIATVEQFKASHKNTSLRTKSLISMIEENRYKKMFINAGYTLEEAATEIGTTEKDLFDAKNWNGNLYTNPVTGLVFIFEWQPNYTGTVWKR